MKKIIFAMLLCSFFTACETFNEAAYTGLQKHHFEKANEFNSAVNPAEKLNKEDYPTYEQYKKEKQRADEDSN